MIVTEIVPYEPKAKDMAEAIEKTVNKKLEEDPSLRFVTFSITPSAKAVLVFEVKKPEEK